MFLISNAKIINEGKNFFGSLLIKNGKIEEIFVEKIPVIENIEVFDATGKILLPGIIDSHVHFREPGLTHKTNIFYESRAAAAGGVTSFFDMPNTIPPTISEKFLQEKFEIAAKKSIINFSFFLGATNENFSEIEKISRNEVAGIKLFLGSSTGNLKIDNEEIIDKIFKLKQIPIVVHCEDDKIISENLLKIKKLYGENIPAFCHSQIRDSESCYFSTKKAIEKSRKFGTQLHVLHLSTEKELEFFEKCENVAEKQITAEVCLSHLIFFDQDYSIFGHKIKCNPSIKSVFDRDSLWEALKNNQIDTISTDNAPHLLDEKLKSYLESPSGIPSIQFSLQLMLEKYLENKISLEKIVEKMCHNPAKIFRIEKRGFIRKNYFADLVLIDLFSQKISKNKIFSLCNWSPFENIEFKSRISQTFVNGICVFDGENFAENCFGEKISFLR